jgi:hypothetical protein
MTVSTALSLAAWYLGERRRDLLSGGCRGCHMRKQWDWRPVDGEKEKAAAEGVAAGLKFRVSNFEKNTGRVG